MTTQDASDEPRLRTVGVIRSTITTRREAPKQGNEGAPDVWLEVHPWAADGLLRMAPGDEIIVITWLHQGRRDTYQVHPRGDTRNPLTGVFATRSPDRPNPLGLHQVVVREIAGARLRIGPMEAIDGTPVVDIKPVLPTHTGCSDEFLPVFDVSDTVATVVNADVAATWQALMEVDLIEVGRKRPLVGVLGALRGLPDIVSHLLHGEPLPRMPERVRLRDTAAIPAGEGGWVLLAERPQQEIALGLVGRFWRPVIEFAAVSRETFRDFAEPGYAKTVYALAVRPLDGGRTLLSGTMRTATTDENARRWFRRYWTLGVGSGAHVLVQGVLDVTRELAEGVRS